MIWHYLSFADTVGGKARFLGAALVEADDTVAAVKEAYRLGCNPGGEVFGMPFERVPPLAYRNRLLTRDEVAAMMVELDRAYPVVTHRCKIGLTVGPIALYKRPSIGQWCPPNNGDAT